MDEVSLGALQDNLRVMFARVFAKGGRLSPVDFAEKVRRLPRRESGSNRFSFDYAPYQRYPYECLFDENTLEVVFQLFSRGGKTELVMNAMGYWVVELPSRILVLYPTESAAEKWSKQTLMTELVEPTKAVADILGEGRGRRKSSNTILFKQFPGGYIQAFGGRAPAEMRRAKGNRLFADEIDSIEQEDGDEGDVLKIFDVRGNEYSDTIKIRASYPSLMKKSRIQKRLDESDYNEFHVGCLKCGRPWVMHRNDVRFPEGKPELAELECPKCNAMMDDAARWRMIVEACEVHREHIGKGLNPMDAEVGWIPRNEFKGVRGFHANGMLWPHPVQKGYKHFLHSVAERTLSIESSENPEKAKQVIVTTFDAEPYEPSFETKPDTNRLMARREDYQPNIKLPEGVLFITAGADVQKDRIECEIVGWGRDQQSWRLDYVVIKGHVMEGEVWEGLERVLQREFNHPYGAKIRIGATAVDCGFWRDRVMSFCKPRMNRRVYAVRGSTTLGAPIIKGPTHEGTIKCPVWVVGTDEAKSVIYHRLELEPDAETGALPMGYMHFPKSPAFREKYFRMLTSEDFELVQNQGTWLFHFVVPEEHVRNEALDTAVYNLAIERMNRPNYRKVLAKLKKLRAQRQAGRAIGEADALEMDDGDFEPDEEKTTATAKKRKKQRAPVKGYAQRGLDY